MRSGGGREWRRRHAWATAVRAGAVIVPLACAAGGALLVSSVVPHPSGLWALAWWALVAAIAAVIARGFGPLAQRARTLATLLDVTVDFPHAAPSRVRVAAGAVSASALQNRLALPQGSRPTADLTARRMAVAATLGAFKQQRLHYPVAVRAAPAVVVGLGLVIAGMVMSAGFSDTPSNETASPVTVSQPNHSPGDGSATSVPVPSVPVPSVPDPSVPDRSLPATSVPALVPTIPESTPPATASHSTVTAVDPSTEEPTGVQAGAASATPPPDTAVAAAGSSGALVSPSPPPDTGVAAAGSSGALVSPPPSASPSTSPSPSPSPSPPLPAVTTPEGVNDVGTAEAPDAPEPSDRRLPTVAPPSRWDDHSDGAVNGEVDDPDDPTAGVADRSDLSDLKHAQQESNSRASSEARDQ
jgi:hypothetical protein